MLSLPSGILTGTKQLEESQQTWKQGMKKVLKEAYS